MGKERSSKKAGWLAAAVLGANLGAVAAWADEARSLAKELSRGARKAGIERVAVLPLIPAAGVSPEASRDLSERITTELVRDGRLQLIERVLLGRLMEEHALARTGIVDQSSLRRLGKVHSVDAVLTGTFVSRAGRTLVNARIIHLETGAVLAAAQARLEGSIAARPQALAPFIAEEEIAGEPLAELFSIDEEEKSDLKDSLAGLSCAGAAERIDDLEGQVLDLKARHWAAQLGRGVSLARLQSTGMIISGEALRRDFYFRVLAHAREGSRGLSTRELRHLALVDGRAFEIHRGCAL